jgi:hypothetical protein
MIFNFNIQVDHNYILLFNFVTRFVLILILYFQAKLCHL